MKKKFISILLTGCMLTGMLAGCGSTTANGTAGAATGSTAEASSSASASQTAEAAVDDKDMTETEKIIKEAEGMSMEELGKKAIEESNGKTFYGVGNSSRGKAALPLFISYLQTLDSSYKMDFEWQQPKNNKIFEQLQADSLKDQGTFAMTLI